MDNHYPKCLAKLELIYEDKQVISKYVFSRDTRNKNLQTIDFKDQKLFCDNFLDKFESIIWIL